MVRKSHIKPVLTLLFVFAIIAACGVPRHKSVSTNADEPVRDAFYYYTEGIKSLNIYGDSIAAKSYFREAVLRDSSFAPAYYQIANLIKNAHPEGALELSSQASAIDTANLDYRAQKAQLLIMTGAYYEALRLYNRLLHDDPKNPMYYWMLAVLYDYRDQPFSAISVLDSAEYKLGRMEQLTSYKRQLMVRTKLYDKAIDETKTMIAESPYVVDNYVVLGDIYAAKGNDSLAMVNYDEALRLDSENVSAILSLAGYHYAAKNVQGYLKTLAKLFVLESYPLESKLSLLEEITSNIDLYRNNYVLVNSLITSLAIMYPTEYKVIDQYSLHLLRSGQMETALNLFKNWITNHPGQLEAYYAIFDLESYMMRPDSVYKYADMAISRFPDNMKLYLSKGFAQHQMKLYDGALESYHKAFDLGTTNEEKSSAAGIIGDLYHEKGESAKSYRYYRKALKLDPDNISVLNNYAYYLSEEGGNLKKALEMSRHANELSPSNPTFMDTEAWILYLMGDYLQAKELMQQAVALDTSNSPVLLLHYGDILYKLGDYFLATNYWKRALDKGIDRELYDERLEWPEPDVKTVEK